MSKKGEVVSLSVDFCASMLAVVLSCHIVTENNKQEEFWAMDIIKSIGARLKDHEICGYIPYSMMLNSADAIHQGFKIFKAGIESLAVSVIQKDASNHGEVMMNPFDDLQQASRGFRLKFHDAFNIGRDAVICDRAHLTDRFERIRSLLYKNSKGFKSKTSEFDTIEQVVAAYFH